MVGTPRSTKTPLKLKCKNDGHCTKWLCSWWWRKKPASFSCWDYKLIEEYLFWATKCWNFTHSVVIAVHNCVGFIIANKQCRWISCEISNSLFVSQMNLVRFEKVFLQNKIWNKYNFHLYQTNLFLDIRVEVFLSTFIYSRSNCCF